MKRSLPPAALRQVTDAIAEATRATSSLLSRRPRMFRISMLAALALAACAPTLIANQSFLVSEELKLAPSGYASLKSTGETFDLGPVKKQEPKTDRIQILKIHGSYVLVGDGFRKAWALWPGGKDEM